MSRSLNTLVTGAKWIFLGMFISKLLGYVYRLIVARIGASEYGAISLGIIIMSISPIIALMGLDLGILRYAAFYKAKKDEARTRGSIVSVLFISGILSIIFFLIVFFGSGTIAQMFFGDKSLAYIIKILSLTLPFYVLARIFLASIRAFEKIKYLFYSQYLLENIFKIVTALILIYGFGLGIVGAAIAHVIAIITVAFFSLYFFTKYVFNIFSKNFVWIRAKMISYSWPLMFATLGGMLLVWIDNLMIGYLLKDTVKLGIYNAAAPTAMLMLVSQYAILGLFTPVMSGLLAKKSDEDMNVTYKSVMKWTLLINFPLFLIMFFLSKPILGILFGKIYSAGGGSLSILVSGYLIYTVLFASRNILEVFKKTKLIMANLIFVLILNIILNYFLILRYGIVGAAIATAISVSILGILYFCEVIILEGMNPFDKYYIKIILINCACFFLVYKILNLVLNKTILYFILFGASFGILYLVLLIKLKCLSKEELNLIKAFKNKVNLSD